MIKLPDPKVCLAEFDKTQFVRGRSLLVELLWLVVQAAFVSTWIPGAAPRRFVLKLFGARIGKGINIKPGLRVKFPWRLTIGDHSWIGESVWLDNLAEIEIGANCCISQGAYLCTGSHDWTSSRFGLVVKPIKIAEGAWLGAGSVVAPGVCVGAGAVLMLGGAAFHNLEPWTIYGGVPAVAVRSRQLDR